MSKLPAPTEVVDEATSYARKYLDEAKGLLLFGSPLTVWDPNFGSWAAQNFCKILALSGPHELQWVVDNARAGWHDADKALRDVYSALKHHRKDVPPALQAYTDEVVLRGSKGPGRGKLRSKNAFADIVIASLVVNLVRRFDLPPTRRRTAKHRRSACDIVASVVNETKWVGRPLHYDRIEGLWAKYSKGFV